MVSQEETVLADEGAGTAVIQAHAREPNVVEPGLGGSEIIFLLQLFDWGIVKGPGRHRLKRPWRSRSGRE